MYDTLLSTSPGLHSARTNPAHSVVANQNGHNPSITAGVHAAVLFAAATQIGSSLEDGHQACAQHAPATEGASFAQCQMAAQHLPITCAWPNWYYAPAVGSNGTHEALLEGSGGGMNPGVFRRVSGSASIPLHKAAQISHMLSTLNALF